MTVREMLGAIRQELLDHSPADALTTSEYIVRLAALLGNIHDEMDRAEGLYIGHYHSIIEAQPKMASDKQKILAMDSEHYRDFQRAKRLSELVLEMIGGLKYRSRALTGEWRESHQQ
jgi:hypothetical protein